MDPLVLWKTIMLLAQALKPWQTLLLPSSHLSGRQVVDPSSEGVGHNLILPRLL